jgi:cytochrome c553
VISTTATDQAVHLPDEKADIPRRRSTRRSDILRLLRRFAMMKALTILLTPLIGLVALSTRPADGIGLTGTEIAHHGNDNGAPSCTTCHGERFQGEPTLKAPALAGLPGAFIVSRLAHYAGPDGHNALMRQVATALSPEERKAVAAYLSTLPPAGE